VHRLTDDALISRCGQNALRDVVPIHVAIVGEGDFKRGIKAHILSWPAGCCLAYAIEIKILASNDCHGYTIDDNLDGAFDVIAGARKLDCYGQIVPHPVAARLTQPSRLQCGSVSRRWPRAQIKVRRVIRTASPERFSGPADNYRRLREQLCHRRHEKKSLPLP